MDYFDYERKLADYFNNLKTQILARPLNLGGVSSVGGGVGGPPGGFVGRLPQIRVTYDFSEAETWDEIPSSGASGLSLLTNLNRIRYRIKNLEDNTLAGGIRITDVGNSFTASGISTIDFDGATLTDLGGNTVRVSVSGVGTGILNANDTSTVNLTYTGGNLSADVTPSGIKLDDLGTPDDNTDLNASTSRHGLLPKLPNDSSKYLNGVGSWATVTGGDGDYYPISGWVDLTTLASGFSYVDANTFTANTNGASLYFISPGDKITFYNKEKLFGNYYYTYKYLYVTGITYSLNQYTIKVAGSFTINNEDGANSIRYVKTSKLATPGSLGTHASAIEASGEGSGWTFLDREATYASASTFTILGNATKYLNIGDKLKINQGSDEYCYVVDLSFSWATKLTTVTVLGKEVYDDVINYIFYSHAQSPAEFPEWFYYEPSLSGWSDPPYYYYCQYRIDGRLVTVSVRQEQGGGGTSNSTGLTISAPVAARNTDWGVLCWEAMDNDKALTTPAKAVIENNSSTITCYKDAATGAWTDSGTKLVNFILQYGI